MNDDLDYNTLIDSFAMTTLGDMLDTLDRTGSMRKLAECLYMHKMPVTEIFPFLTDYAKLIRKDREQK